MATDTTADAAPDAPIETAPPPAEGPPSRAGRVGIVLPIIILLIAGAVRFIDLGYPERIYFDETYYAPQGLEMLTNGVEEGFAVHPPLGKWLIAAGIEAFGYACNDPTSTKWFGGCYGFRSAAAAAGTLTVLITYFIGLRLFRRRGVAALGAFFVAIDGLALTMSRIAMLDIFLAMFVALGVWFLLIDRDEMWRDLPAPLPEPVTRLPHRSRRWRWLAGVAFGLALATKWSAILAIGGAGLFVGSSEMLWRHRVTGSPWTALWRPAVGTLLALLVLPAFIYVVSYAGWFANYESTRLGLERCPNGECTLTPIEVVREWWGEQRQIARFHDNLEAEHPYRSHPARWPWLGRPVAYYYENCTDEKLADGECVVEQGNVEEILGVGNPVIWWLGLLAFPAALWFGYKRRDWVAAAVVGFYLVQYVPWLFVPRPNFLFYLTPAVPFLCLTLAYAVWRVSAYTWLRWVPAAAGVLAVVAFLFFWPVWTGQEMPLDTWQLRIWMRSWI